MPFLRPSLSDGIARVLAFFKARLPGADTTLRRSNIVVTARVQAGLSHEQYGYLDWLAQQLMPDTAEAEYLRRWLANYQVSVPGAGTASGNVIFSGIAATDIPNGTALTRSGVNYQTTIDAAIGGGGTVSVPVQALTAGAAGNVPAGGSLNVGIAIAGVNGTAVADGNGLTGGVDPANDNTARAALMARLGQPPQGGNANDYVTWVKNVSGDYTRAWAFANWMGPGTVGVFFVCDNRPDIIPTSTDVAAVTSALAIKRPITAELFVLAPSVYSLDLTIRGLTPFNGATQAAVAAAVTELLSRDLAPGGSIAYADLDAAIEAASGVTYHFLETPNSDVAVPAGAVALLGTITYL